MLALKVPPPVLFVMTALSMFALSGFAFPLVNERLLFVAVIWFVSLMIAAAAIWSFLQLKTTVNPHRPDQSTTLVVAGIFHYSRNPMYLSLVLILLGWGVLLHTMMVVLPVVGFVVYLTYFQIKPEETILMSKFGDDYRQYCAQVRRWL